MSTRWKEVHSRKGTQTCHSISHRCHGMLKRTVNQHWNIIANFMSLKRATWIIGMRGGGRENRQPLSVRELVRIVEQWGIRRGNAQRGQGKLGPNLLRKILQLMTYKNKCSWTGKVREIDGMVMIRICIRNWWRNMRLFRRLRRRKSRKILREGQHRVSRSRRMMSIRQLTTRWGFLACLLVQMK